MVKTDIAIAIPPGTYARIAPRSGLAVKHFIDTGKQQPLVLRHMLQAGHGHGPCISLYKETLCSNSSSFLKPSLALSRKAF